MNDRELLQEALDAMEENWRSDKSDLAIEALRARLAQSEQEPVAWGLQQQFEGKIGTASVAFKQHDEFGFVVPLYTAPPQRGWVGLTDDDHEDFCKRSNLHPLIAQTLAEFIEAKLKEKNT